MERKWLEKLLIKSIIFALFLFLLFFVLKLCFVLYSGVYNGAIGEAKWSEYFGAFFNGLRYDCRYIAGLSITYFVLGLIFFWTKFRWFVLWIYALLVVVLSLFIGIAEMVFYEIFDDVFNANLLGLIFDDQRAIFHTGISGQYGISFKIIAWLLLSFVFMWLYTKTFNAISREYERNSFHSIRRTHRESPLSSIILFVIFALFMMICINSAFSFKGVSLDQVIKPVENNFLRKASPGAFRDLYLVYRGYAKISNSHFSDYIKQRPTEVVEEYFGLDSKAQSYNLKDLLAKKVSNTAGKRIDYVFYIVAESLSEWYFDEEFDGIGLSAGLKSLLQDNHGAKIGVFLENAGSTIKSMDIHLTGLFQTEIPVNSVIGTLEPFITSTGAIMQNLGYRTNFYYGGSGIWQKLDQYTASQGFEQIYYSTHIINNAKFNGYPSPYEGLWGAYDHHLFALVRDNVFKERNAPSFNMILTTSNHPPYDVPLEQFGVPLEQIRDFLAHNPRYGEKGERLMGHIWYADKVITRFIQDVSRVLPNSLFVITGDHYDREYPNASLKTRNSVPFILYSPVLELKKIANIGSHIDITPSVIELVAPHDYVYHSFGEPLVSNDNMALNEKNSALGYFSVATDRFVYDGEGVIEYFHEGTAQHNDKELAKSLYKRLQQATALSWWILKNGYEVRDTP